jgi:GntR family transcriptional regulator/MocR family aminotransferase
MSPSPLSAWYLSSDDAASGLLLGVATTPMKNLDRSCDRLLEAIRHSRLPALP